MKKFMLLYKGPATPPDASHAGWPEWFNKIGEALVDVGSPMANGKALHEGGTVSEATVSLNGYSIIQAEDAESAFEVAKDHPYLKLGNAYTVEVFEVPTK